MNTTLKNLKHEAFVQAVAQGATQGEAYRQHVSAGRCSAATARREANRLLQKPAVAARLGDLRHAVSMTLQGKFAISREVWLEQLTQVASHALASDNFTAATSALDKIGKASGWYAPKKMEHRADETLLQALNTIRSVTHA